MKKLASILVLVAVVLAACGGAGAVAASVNDTDITIGEVESLIDTEGSTISKEQFAQFLGFEIQWEIAIQASMAQWGIEITEGEIDAEADRIYETANANETRAEFLSNRSVTEEFLRNVAHQGLLDLAVREELAQTILEPTQTQIDAEIESSRLNLTTVCVSHILVETEAEAQDVADRLAAGEVFGEVAAEVSLDPGSADNNGILPCSSPSGYVPEFRDATLVAPINEVHETFVETQFGFHVMLVTDRVEPAAEDLPTEDEVAEGFAAQAVGDELNVWFLEQMTAADVTVDERYGTWEAAPQPGVTPPSE